MKLMRVTDPEDVLKMIVEQFSPLASENLPIERAGGRCLAEALTAPEDVPGFTR